MELKHYLLKTCIILGLFVFIFITLKATYSKYKEQISGNTKIEIASWNIKVNNEAINHKTTLTNNIEPTFLENEHIKNGVLAPGSEGYYDIIIDPSEVDVSFTYKLTVLVSPDSTVKDLIITGYEENIADGTNIIKYQDAITGTIEKNSTKKTIRIYIKWEDDENTVMDNIADTNAIIDLNAKAVISNKMEFSQLK